MTVLPQTLWTGAEAAAMKKSLKQLDLHELDDLAARIENDPAGMARQLFPDRPEEGLRLIELIGKWAIHQKLVLESTSGNMPHVAHVFEKVARRIWQHLPEHVRVIRIDLD